MKMMVFRFGFERIIVGRGRNRQSKLEAILVRSSSGLVEVTRSSWIQLRAVGIFCFMFRARQLSLYRWA